MYPLRIEIIVLVIVNLFVYKSLIGLIFSPKRLNKYFINNLVFISQKEPLQKHIILNGLPFIVKRICSLFNYQGYKKNINKSTSGKKKTLL